MYVSYLMIAQFIAVIIYLNLLSMVLQRNHKDKMNLAFASFLVCCIWWGVFAMFRMVSHSGEGLVFWSQVSSLGWITFPACFLWFALIFVGKDKAMEGRKPHLILFLLPAILILSDWIKPFNVSAVNNNNAWSTAWSHSIWTYLYFLYYFLSMSVAFYFLFRYYRRTDVKLRKKQALIIIFSTLIPVLFGTVSSIVLPLLKMSPEISKGNTYVVFWALGMYYAVARFGLFKSSFSLAGKNIVDNMSESLLLLDKSGQIIDANNQAMKFLRVGREELVNHGLSGYFRGETLEKIKQMLETGSNLESQNTKVVLTDDSTSPVLFSCSRVTGKDDVFMGWVCMIGDISRQKKDEADLAARNVDLGDKLAELERFQKIVVDRELKMIELKKEIEVLKVKLSA